MTTRNVINKLIFDIETIKADDYENFMPEFKEPRKNKDGSYNKTDKTVDEQRKDWESKLALSPLTGQIACIGFLLNENYEIRTQADEYDEQAMLTDFSLYLNDADIIIGHNIKEFDLWFIVNRLRKHHLPIPERLYTKYKGRYGWAEHINDTMDLWGMGKYKEMISLDNLCKFYGLKSKDNEISKNFEHYWKNETEKALEHCKQDVMRTRDIYEYMTGDFSDRINRMAIKEKPDWSKTLSEA